jgi:hypothetical protein
MTNANGTANLNRTGLQLEQDQKRQAILDEMVRLCPNVEFEVNKYTTDLVYYSASVVKGKIVITRDTKGIYLNSEPAKALKQGYRTELEARNAINEIMPKAKAHFLDCLTQYRELTNRLNFGVGYNYDGDTHGIYNEYQYISFNLGEFNFSFEIE